MKRSEDLDTKDKKNIVSLRLSASDRLAVRAMASRLFILESELYRLAVCFFLQKLNKLQSPDCAGSDLLPLLAEFRSQIDVHLNLSKNQLFKIINSSHTTPEKFVPMLDIELLVLPDHAVRQRLQQIEEAVEHKHANTDKWLWAYLTEKYSLHEEMSELLAN